MSRKTFSTIMMFLLVISTLTLAFRIQVVRADGGTIYINADGSITPPTAPIYTADNITYTLTGNINITSDYTDGIVIERDNIVLNGAGYIVQGKGPVDSDGMNLTKSSNVTVKNMNITAFYSAISLYSSSNISLDGFPSFLVLPLFFITTLLSTLIYEKKNRNRKKRVTI